MDNEDDKTRTGDLSFLNLPSLPEGTDDDRSPTHNNNNNSNNSNNNPPEEAEEPLGIPDLQRDLEKAEVEFQQSPSPPPTPLRSNNGTTPNNNNVSIRHNSSVSSTTQSSPSVRASSIATSSVTYSSNIQSSISTVPVTNKKLRYLRHQATSLTGDTNVDSYDEDLLHRAVADAGRWAYGTILVEVWLLSHDKLFLIRPHQGWWVDPVHHSQFHTVPTEAEWKKKRSLRMSKKKTLDASRQQQHMSCPICRLTDESRVDYLEPAPMVPGEGLPGVLWQDDHNPRFVGERGGGGSTRRGGGTRGGGSLETSRRGSQRGSRRGSFMGGGSINGSRGFLFPKMQQMYQGGANSNDQDDTDVVETELSETPKRARDSGPAPPAYSTPDWKKDINEDILLSVPAAPDSLQTPNQPNNATQQQPYHHLGARVVWRNIKDLAYDPDSPYNPRLTHMADTGLGWAAAVPIRYEGQKQGIVIYMARQDVDLDKLKSPTNEDYLVAASNLISAALILRTPRHNAIQERQKEHVSALRRIRARILQARASGILLNELVEENAKKRQQEEQEAMTPPLVEAEPGESFFKYQRDRFLLWLRTKCQKLWTSLVTSFYKCLGADVKPPPAMTWTQSAHNFFGVLVMILVLTNLNTAMIETNGSNGGILLGPFGALATLLYGLTAAPASQPRNAVLGQLYSVSLARILRYIPDRIWSTETRVSLTTALAVAGMTKFGWTHPPAGAAALLFANSKTLEWANVGALLLGNVISIVLAAVINNWSSKRQYPTYWGIPSDVFGIKEWLQRGSDKKQQ